MVQTNNKTIWSDGSDSGLHLYCIAEAGREHLGPCKIGFSSHLSKRRSNLQCGNPRQLNVVWSIELSNRDVVLDTEQYCLIGFRPNCYGNIKKKKRLKSEWLDTTPSDVFDMASQYINAHEIEIRETPQ